MSKIKFDIINEMNEAIKEINATSFLIRLCALNSQISITNINNKSSGFATISEELIRISNLIEKRTAELFQILHESLQLSTTENKIIRRQNLQKKFIINYHSIDKKKVFNFQEIETSIMQKYNVELLGIKTKLDKHFNSLKSIVIETIKICKFSKPIVYSVKIESSFIGEHLEIFNQLSDELSNSISKIETLLKQIQILNSELQKQEE